jgi:peptidyl-dipeptidase A
MSASYGTLGAIAALAAMSVFGRPAAAGQPAGDNDARAHRFIAAYEATIRPMEIEVARSWWDANVSGKDEDYRKKEAAETRLELRLADPKVFAELKAIHQGRISDPPVARQIHVLYLSYLARQVDPELLKRILAKANAVEQAFNVFRPQIDGKELADGEIRRVLRESTDSARRQAVWEASKRVGRVVEADLKQLIALRNEAARKLGFRDFHVMQLALGEQDRQQVLKLFDELDRLTRKPFLAAKAEIDAALAARYGIPLDQLRPWHYHDPFFQESPDVFGGDLEAVFAPVDIVKTCREFYAGIGLPVDEILKRSDLLEKKGKNPHAFCNDLDREGDVRVLVNLVPSRYWFTTMLHELGHGVYSLYTPRSLPYVLRTDAHPMTTEGVAMLFERYADNAAWLAALGIKVPDPQKFDAAARKLRRNRLLIFSRWCQVMFRFEKDLYTNPACDANRLWWDLVEKYQGLKRPEGRSEPDYAAKIHVCSAPAYYHNYMLGEMFAAQVHRAIAKQMLGGADPATAIYAGNPAAGRFMKDRVFGPGRSLSWNDLTRHATGEPLSPKAFAADLSTK